MDNKVIIYGVGSGGSATPIPIDNNGLVPVDLNLNGTAIQSRNPFTWPIEFVDENLNFVPVVNAPLMESLDSLGNQILMAPSLVNPASVAEPPRAQLVGEVAGAFVMDDPGVNNPASCTADSPGAAQGVRVTGFGINLTAVNAIIAPIRASLISQPGTGNVLQWTALLLAPAGTSKEIWIPGPFYGFEGMQLTCEAPGAGNSVSVSMAFSNVTNPA